MPTYPYPNRQPGCRPSRALYAVPDADLAQLATAIDADAKKLLRRCEDINEALTEALARWNPFAEESEDNYRDPAAEMIPYDSIPDLRDLATRDQLTQLVALIAQQRQHQPSR